MKIGFVLLFVLSACFVNAQKFQNLALTPPIGWNSCNKFSCNLSEKLLKETTDAMVSSAMPLRNGNTLISGNGQGFTGEITTKG